MTITNEPAEDRARAPRAVSRLFAAELRAEMARQGLTKLDLARRLHVSNQWVGRRLQTNSTVQLTLEEAVMMAEALGIPAEGLFAAVLPRLDSNQQPSGYSLSLVRGGVSAAEQPEDRIWWPDATQPAPAPPRPRLVVVEAVAS